MSIEYISDVVQEEHKLNLELLQDALENALLKERFIIEKVVFTMGSSLGENYCSLIYRVNITYKEDHNQLSCLIPKTISMIIKCIHTSENVNFLSDLSVYHKEKTFYMCCLPRLEMLFPNECLKFAPRMYLSEKRPSPLLVFEDLSQLQLAMASREKGLDERHACLVMRKLGQMHAASVILFEKMPEFKLCFQEGILSSLAINRKDSLFVNFIRNNLINIIEMVTTWPDYADITKKLYKYADNLIGNLIKAGQIYPDGFNVLNHGDLWVNNIMFRYNNNDEQSIEKVPIDLCFLDFQLSVWGSPGFDLNYFFYTSLEFNVLQNKTDLLIDEYYHSLSKTLKELDYMKPIPTIEQIKNDISRYKPFGFFAAYSILPLIAMDKNISSDNSFENICNSEFIKEKMKNSFSSSRVNLTLKYILKECNETGFFENC